MNAQELAPEQSAFARQRPGTSSEVPRALAWPAGLFLLITFAVGADMAADLAAGTSPAHMILEAGAFALALAGVFGTGLKLRAAIRDAQTALGDLEVTSIDLAHWRAEAQSLLQGLGSAIDVQFKRWKLTESESQVAMLILKGLSYKEISEVRGTAERTVRHQALTIYRKAGLAGRAEMAAFFLEDLLLPRKPAEPPSATAATTGPAAQGSSSAAATGV